MRARVIICLVSCLVVVLLSAPGGRAGASDEPAVVPYLPEELGEIPGELILFDDRSGFWAGLGAPLVRCIELYRDHQAENRWGEVEIAAGVVVEDYDNSLLLFYYLGRDGSWHRIGHFSTCGITGIRLHRPLFKPRGDTPVTGGLMGVAPGAVSKTSFTRKMLIVESNHTGGNDYREPWINMFSFVPDGTGGVALVDNTIHLSDVSIKEVYDFEGDFRPEFIGYAGWQFWGDVCHAASPDRQLILGLDEDGNLADVSARFPDFYLDGLYGLERGLHRQVRDSYARRFNDTHNDYYIGYVITTLIYYHDMGKHDEGVERARTLFAREYFASDEEYEAKQELIDAAVEQLAEQDAAIQASVEEYNAAHEMGESNGSAE